MLLTLLKLISQNPLASLEDLSRQLSISPQLVEDMVADLSKRGYLKSYEDCSSACQNCSLSRSCRTGVRPKIWSISEKGLALAKKS